LIEKALGVIRRKVERKTSGGNFYTDEIPTSILNFNRLQENIDFEEFNLPDF